MASVKFICLSVLVSLASVDRSLWNRNASVAGEISASEEDAWDPSAPPFIFFLNSNPSLPSPFGQPLSSRKICGSIDGDSGLVLVVEDSNPTLVVRPGELGQLEWQGEQPL